MEQPQVKVWILTYEGRTLVGQIPLHLFEFLAMERRKFKDKRFQLVPEGGDPLTIKDILVEMVG